MYKSATPLGLNKFTKAGNIITAIATAMLLVAGAPAVAQNLLQYVQPLSGTAPSTTASALRHSESGSEANANTIPAVTLPFAMTQWTAQTRRTEIKCQPPYYYKDSLLSGFRGTHWLSGSCTQDYGSFTVMPVPGHLHTSPAGYAMPFSHANETTGPAYYSVTAKNIVTEITSTLRCGLMRFSVLEDDSLYILVMPNSDQQKGFVQVDAEKGEIWGYNPVHRIYQGWGQPAGFNGWFYMKVEEGVYTKGCFSEATVLLQDSVSGKKDIGVYVGFSLKKGESVLLKIGTSFSSLDGARKNLQAEVGNKNFAAVLAASQQQWQTSLSKITVTTGDEKNKRIFYTAMYHAMQHPRLYNDVDGTYPAFSQPAVLANSGKRNYYDDFSMWDIYRAQLPLFELLDPNKTNDFVQSMIAKGQQGSWLPIFPCWNSYTSAMIGDHVTAFIASAYAKGIRNYDVSEAYRLMRNNAFVAAGEKDYTNGMGRRALQSYLQFGYIPMEDSVPIAFHKREQVSRTLEYAYDDYALSVVAKGMDKMDDYRLLRQRSLNYKKVFDRSVGMVRGRYADGRWFESFDPDKREVYITEGTPRQYSFYVPHDMSGLTRLMGGPKKLETALDSLFAKNEYWHGNEPGHQVPFLYNFTASPWKTQQVVRKILTEEYSDGAGGLSGNDDAGQMSAWYVFSAMGFYPVDPVSGDYLLTVPLFDHVLLSLPAGKKFSIACYRSKAGDHFISQVRWNGKPYTKNYLSHQQIAAGGKLEIWLQATPATRGASTADRSKTVSSK